MTRPNLITALLLATAAAGCGDSGGAEHNKAGAPVAATREVLHLEATDAGSTGLGPQGGGPRAHAV